MNLLRYLCGEVEAVQAFQSNAVRNYPVDETTVVIVKFASGALGTMNITDTVVAPWSWEHTTGENPDYPHTDQICYQIGGTHGSLSVPRLELWTNVAGWNRSGSSGMLQPMRILSDFKYGSSVGLSGARKNRWFRDTRV